MLALARDASGALQAGLAGYDSRTLRWRHTFHSLRHGVLAKQQAALPALLTEVSRRGRERGCVSATIGGGPRIAEGAYRESVRHAVRLGLGNGAQSLWDGFRDKTRNTIRRAERAGMTVSNDSAHLGAFHMLYARAMTERSVNARTFKFFRALFSIFGSDARLYSALAGRQLCGAMVIVTVGGHSAYPYGAFDDVGHRLGANSLLLWHAAQDLAAEGVQGLDLGPSAPGSGSYRFKVHMGGMPQELHYVELLQPKGTLQQMTSKLPNARSRGRLDRLIGCLPMGLRIRARTCLGRTGRLL